MTARRPSHRAARDTGRRAAEDRRLLTRYREHGDDAARAELIERLMPLARQLALRYRHSSEPVDDLVQVANLALVKAIDRFDPARGTALSTFAVPTILGELRRYFRDSTWSVRVSRDVKERVSRLERESVALSSHLGRAPSVAELAAALDLSDEEVLEGMEAAGAYQASSLDERLDGAERDGGALLDLLGRDDERFELIEDAAAVGPALAHLDDRARRILRMRFLEDMTQTEIAAALGISQMHVSRLLRRAITTLRDHAGEEVAA